MQDAVHILMISDIAVSAWLIDLCHMAIYSLEKSFKKFYGRYQELIERYQGSVKVMVNDSFQDNLYLTCSRNLVAFVTYLDLSLRFVYT